MAILPARAEADELDGACLTVCGADDRIQVANGLRDECHAQFFLQLTVESRLRGLVRLDLAAR